MAENDIWTIKAALDWTVGYLERKGDENPRLSSQWLLAEACGLSRIELYANFEQPLSLEERDVLRAYVTRRGKGEPLQYITGEVGFRHITVKVRPGVLIPRPETEVLVSEALALLPAVPKRVAADSAPEPQPSGPDGEPGEKPSPDDPASEDVSREHLFVKIPPPPFSSLPISARAPAASPARSPTSTRSRACWPPTSRPRPCLSPAIAPEAVSLARDNAAALVPC
ncbi:N5-glutamine methyltransferase family protein, partial [Eggerthella sinensis]|uniref:N5-glutamine methyltransferase family protein n=1 Tax=Eggerthella sinensis TaxID=242230 RepID=UPI003A4E0E98